jgi:hypothetical protein
MFATLSMSMRRSKESRNRVVSWGTPRVAMSRPIDTWTAPVEGGTTTFIEREGDVYAPSKKLSVPPSSVMRV